MKASKHLFVFAPGVMDSTSIEEIEATKHGLQEVGLYQMPYERDVYIQINALECVGLDANPQHSMIYGPFGKGQVVGIALHAPELGVTSSPEAFNEPETIAVLESILIVLLATKNAQKHTTESKLAKLGIGKSLGHRFAYTTTISLPSNLAADPDNPPKGIKVAPHLRRGHVRRQHYGAENSLEKKIWIAPVFVNADPEFVATRRKYRISR